MVTHANLNLTKPLPAVAGIAPDFTLETDRGAHQSIRARGGGPRFPLGVYGIRRWQLPVVYSIQIKGSNYGGE